MPYVDAGFYLVTIAVIAWFWIVIVMVLIPVGLFVIIVSSPIVLEKRPIY